MSTPPVQSAQMTLRHSVSKKTVPFEFFLPKFVVQQSAKPQSFGHTFYRDDQVTDLDALSFNLQSLRFEGRQQMGHVETLLSWLEKDADDKTENVEANILQFNLGKAPRGMAFPVLLKKVTAKYTRFDGHGQPIRAEVSLTLQVHKPKVKGQNPTSAGPGGGRTHVVADGDNLQRIASRAYENPEAWRAIATANGINDPLRVRNGHTVILPGAGRPSQSDV